MAFELNMPKNKTICKLWAKTIYLNEKPRKTYNGKKFKHYVEGSKNRKIFKNLQKEDLVKNNKDIIATNGNTWATNDINKDWINQVYVSYFKNFTYSR